MKEATEFDRDAHQLVFRFPEELERAQRERDRRRWEVRLTEIEHQLATDLRRIRDSYVIKAVRVDPVGIVYLWPRTN